MHPSYGDREWFREPDGAEIRPEFRITDEATADWAVRKIAKIRGDFATIKELYDHETEMLDQWLEAEEEKSQRDEAYFLGLLRGWHELQIAEDSGRKTINLPGGSLKARRSPESVVVTDEATLLDFAKKNHPTWIRTKHEVNKHIVKKEIVAHLPEAAIMPKELDVVDENGEPVPGARLAVGQVSYTVETKS